MVINRINKTLIVLIAIFSVYQITGLSQGTDINSGKKSRLWIGFSVNPGMSTINNTNSASLKELSAKGKSSLSFSTEAGFMFSNNIGISTGIGYSSFKSEILLNSYTITYDTADVIESYKRTITGNNIKEKQEISFLKIPLLLNIQIPLGRSLEFYFRPGVNFSLPISKNYEGSGTFTYSGYYSAYNVTITDVKYEGFEKDYSTSDEGGLQIKSFNTELSVSAGIHYNIQEKVQIGFGVAYEKLLSDISAYSDVANFRLSSKPDQMRSIMEGSAGATANSIGLRISLRFLL